MDRIYGRKYQAAVNPLLKQVAEDFPGADSRPGLKDVILHN